MSGVRASDIVSHKVREWEGMRAQILQMCPDLDEDEQALIDTVDGETDLTEVLASLARAAKHREAQAKAMKDLLDRYRERQARHKSMYDSLRKIIGDAMVRTKQKSIKTADVTLSVRPLDPVYELAPDADIEMIPDEYITTEIVKKVDMEKVIAAAENGVDLDFIVKQDDRYSITIRV